MRQTRTITGPGGSREGRCSGVGSGTLPSWLRWLTLVIGVLAIGAPAYLPSFAVPIWGIVVGVWLIGAGRVRRPAVMATQQSA